VSLGIESFPPTLCHPGCGYFYDESREFWK
jgi:hypothetical protein